MNILKQLNQLFTRKVQAPDPEVVKRFQERVRTLAADDPLWPGLLATLDAKVLSEAQYAATSRTAEESHHAAGKLAALIELRAELDALPAALRAEDGGQGNGV